MLDWTVTEEELPEDPQNETPPRHPKRWGWVLGVLGVLVIVGVGVWYFTQQRLESSDAAMRQDLLAFITEESSQRMFDGPRDAAAYAVPDAPTEWVTRYESTFYNLDDWRMVLLPAVLEEWEPSSETTLEPFTLIGDTVFVGVKRDNDAQQRAYRLTPDGWRRAPLGNYDFGATATLGGADEGVTVNYRESDQAFAEQFFDDIATFKPIIAQSSNSQTPPYTIQIEPTELRGALLQSAGPASLSGVPVRRRFPPSHTLIVNSPQTVEMPPNWHISSASAIRYTYAIWALQQLHPTTEEAVASTPLPNYMAFVAASQQVLALKWALSPEEFEDVAVLWRTLGGKPAPLELTNLPGTPIPPGEPVITHHPIIVWESPFSPLAVVDTKIDPFYPDIMQARLLAVANAAYANGDNDRLVTMITPTPPSFTTWDAWFTELSGTTTLTMEALARGETTPATPPTLPLTGKIVVPPMLNEGPTADSPTAGVYLEPDDGSAPIWIEGWGTATITVPRPDTTPLTLPGSCLPLFSEVTLDGTWTDAGLRLHATTITAQSETPPRVYSATTAPPESVALVADNTANNTYGSGFSTFTALLPDGTRSTVVENQRADPRLFNSFGPIERNGVLMLPHPTLAHDCTATWLSQYVPSRGITGNWLVTWENGTSFPIWFWDAPNEEGNRQGILFLDSDDPTRPLPYWRLTMGATKVLGDPDGYLPAGRPRLLRPGGEAVLLQQENPIRYQLISIATGEVLDEYIPPPDKVASEVVFTSDGAALVMTVNYRTDNSLRSTVLRYDLATKQTTTLWEPNLGAIYNLAVDHSPERLAVYATTRAAWSPNNYLSVLAAGVQPREPQILAEDTGTARFLSYLACQNRGVGYLTAAPTIEASGDSPTLFLTLMGSTGFVYYDRLPLATGDTVLMCWT